MATTIKLKNSVTTTAAPSSLVQGEVATNVTDKKLWVGNAASSPVQLLGAGASATLTSLTTSSDSSISGLTVGKGGGAVSSNTAVGYQAINASATGTANTALGYLSLTALTSGINNTGLGRYALGANTTGSENLAVGRDSVAVNTTGSYNTGIGNYALQSNTTANNNTAVGYQAGYSGTTGTQNVLLGVQTGYNLTTGSYNTFCGYASGFQITTGAKNTIIGQYGGNQGGLDLRTASNYIVLSDGDGNPRQVINGSGQAFFNQTSAVNGEYLGVTANGNAFLVKNTANGGTARLVYMNGNGTIDFFYNYATSTTTGTISATATTVAYNTSSDYRLKENIAPMTGALATVSQLKPVTYNWKADGSSGQGFIAHELAEICPEAVSGEKDAVDAEGKPVYQGIDTSFLVATLVSAIQELKAEVDSLKQQLGK